MTIYHQLGLPPDTSLLNRSGRPVTIGSNGEIISELLA